MVNVILLLIVLLCVALPMWIIVYGIKNRSRFEKRWSERHEAYISRTGGRIVEVEYLGTGREKQRLGGMKGAALGGFFGGMIGALVGTVLPDGVEESHRFWVRYSSGLTEIREVKPNSGEYKELMDYVALKD